MGVTYTIPSHGRTDVLESDSMERLSHARPVITHPLLSQAQELHQLWLICNLSQRHAWLATLSEDEAQLLHTYQASLSVSERDPRNNKML